METSPLPYRTNERCFLQILPSQTRPYLVLRLQEAVPPHHQQPCHNQRVLGDVRMNRRAVQRQNVGHRRSTHRRTQEENDRYQGSLVVVMSLPSFLATTGAPHQ